MSALTIFSCVCRRTTKKKRKYLKRQPAAHMNQEISIRDTLRRVHAAQSIGSEGIR